ncbi:MAG: hypothetical protein VX438_04685, partial [Planctomycetota bacterium]|nr:hypothetical protein [Planctomycetota bacterium]
MTTRPKRKYTFGLIAKLCLIAAFLGLGSWAVFGSKLKQPAGAEIAKNEERTDPTALARQPSDSADTE